jgi:tetratricopeptide (TPR) repeat protein
MRFHGERHSDRPPTVPADQDRDLLVLKVLRQATGSLFPISQGQVLAARAGQRRYDEARDLFAQTVAACRRAHPPRQYEIAVHLHNVAAIDQATGRMAEAERGYRAALGLKEKLLGSDHPEVALVANNLGTLLSRLGRTSEAADLHRRAVAIVEQRYPDGHPTTQALRDNLRGHAVAHTA